MQKRTLKNILNFLKEQRGFDFNAYRSSMLERRIQKRLDNTSTNNLEEYFEYLMQHPEELDKLIDVFTINVSRFFRNTLSFEYISKKIIPGLIMDKLQSNDNTLRIWSAGCSFSEEPYSIAIIINEFLKKEKISISLNIFATDIDNKALKGASEGCYGFDEIAEVKFNIFNKYFTQEDGRFKLSDEIKNMVQFSSFDLLDKNHSVPQESIFGGFDMVFCRNVLIYFNVDYQKAIFSRLYKSLNQNGYLILGEAEIPIEGFNNKFRRVNKSCKIYRKVYE